MMFLMTQSNGDQSERRGRFINVCSVEPLKVSEKMQKLSQAMTERLHRLHIIDEKREGGW